MIRPAKRLELFSQSPLLDSEHGGLANLMSTYLVGLAPETRVASLSSCATCDSVLWFLSDITTGFQLGLL